MVLWQDLENGGGWWVWAQERGNGSFVARPAFELMELLLHLPSEPLVVHHSRLAILLQRGIGGVMV